MKAEASRHKVGAAQKDTAEERADALARGSATSESFGIKAMGERFNALMTIQIPLLQKKPASIPMSLASCAAPAPGLPIMAFASCAAPPPPGGIPSMSMKKKKFAKAYRGPLRSRSSAPLQVGTASAARISRGDFVEKVGPLPLERDAVRHPDEHVTVTVVLYHAVKGGVPSAEDARAAVDELERMYSSCNTSGKLAEKKFNPIKFGVVDPSLNNGSVVPCTSVDIVMKKIAEFASAQNEKFMEMKLVTLGAIDDAAAKDTIAKKLNAIKSQLDQGNSIEEGTIAELKLLVKGAM